MSIKQLEDVELFFADFVSELVDINKENVRIQYQQDGQPFSKINEDVVYVEAETEQADILKFLNSTKQYVPSLGIFNASNIRMRMLKIIFIFYGNNSFENATKLNEKILFESSKVKLAKDGYRFISGNVDGPTKLHEEYGKRWWKRCDLTLRFYEQISVEEEVSKLNDFVIRTEVEQ